MAALYPYLIAAIAIGCYASLAIIAKKSLLTSIPPFSLMSISMLILCVYSVAASLIFERKFSLQALKLSDWRTLLFFALVNFIGFALYLVSIQKMPIAHYQIIGVIGPIVGMALAYFFLGESIQPKYFAGLALIGAGLYVALVK